MSLDETITKYATNFPVALNATAQQAGQRAPLDAVTEARAQGDFNAASYHSLRAAAEATNPTLKTMYAQQAWAFAVAGAYNAMNGVNFKDADATQKSQLHSLASGYVENVADPDAQRHPGLNELYQDFANEGALPQKGIFSAWRIRRLQIIGKTLEDVTGNVKIGDKKVSGYDIHQWYENNVEGKAVVKYVEILPSAAPPQPEQLTFEPVPDADDNNGNAGAAPTPEPQAPAPAGPQQPADNLTELLGNLRAPAPAPQAPADDPDALAPPPI